MKFAIYGDANDITAFKPRTARAYCDGRKANADGVLIGDCPFDQEREKENRSAWIYGHSSYPGQPAGYCAI